MDAYALATRNTVEVVTTDELRELLKKDKKRVYAGYEPSGEIHLGHLVTVSTSRRPGSRSSSCSLTSMHS